MSERKASAVAWVSAAVLLALIGVYVGLYYATVRPFGGGRSVVAIYTPPWHPYFRPPYHWILDEVFSPMHKLDRRIRRHVWEKP